MTLGLLTVLGAGLLTFLTPCVLPLVPIYLAALVGGDSRQLATASRGKLVGRAALFSLGFIAVFVLMGIGASSVGALLSDHRSAIQAGGAVLVLVLALKFLGVIRISWLDRTIRADESRYQGRFGAAYAVVMGVLFAAGWSPCVGPVLGSVLTYTASTTSSPAVGALYLGAYGLGFALPLMAVAAFAEAGLALLRRLRSQLPRLEKATGILLLAVAALLAHDAAAGWPTATAGELATSEPQGDVVPERAMATPTSSTSPAEAPNAPAVDRPTDRLPRMVELYAQQCPICQRMKPVVEALTTQCDEHGVRVRAIDVSRPENRGLVARYRVVGVPTFLFLDEQGTEVARLVGEQPEATLRQALSALRGAPCPGLGAVPDGPYSPPSGASTSCSVEPTSLASREAGGESAPEQRLPPPEAAADATCGPGTI